jgi:hypothetical protein
MTQNDSKKMAELQNCKSLSSTDFEQRGDIDTKEKLAKFANASEISSEDLFGKQSKTNSSKIDKFKGLLSEASAKVKTYASNIINFKAYK